MKHSYMIPATLLLLITASTSHGQFTRLSNDARAVANGNNVFAAELYARLGKEDGNLFFSPYSISSALAMTYGGARGQTAEQMATTMHFALGQEKLHPAVGELTRYLRAKKQGNPYQLNIANSLWGQQGFGFVPDFLKLTDTQYGAKLTELDFVNNTELARQTINKWVEKETQNRIKDLIARGIVNKDIRLVLTNAIYFKALWKNKFNKKSTQPGDFTLADGKKIKVPMMAKSESLSFVDEGSFQMVNIPYINFGLTMTVLLPKKANGLAQMEKRLSSTTLEQWHKKMRPHLVDLKLPRFKVTAEFKLKDALIDMGMPLAFNPNADFTGMSTKRPLYIGQVVHKAFVDVHEEGTEAAAATAVVMTFGSAPGQPPRATFHADRPFVFLIRDNNSGAILFMGRVANPDAK